MGEELLLQAGKAGAYYLALIILMRLAGKRLAGQTTTFDLIILITLGVVLQTTALQQGFWNAAVFIVTVFVLHRLVALLCARSSFFRHLIRGKPRQLIRDGQVLEQSLLEEGISHAELKAGLRKLGIEDIQQVKTATLEETGHISAVTK
jgi:uncharacterized membrane protein YcaP (DUF421 family)